MTKIRVLSPRLVIPVGKLAVGLFLPQTDKLVDVVGRTFRVRFAGIEVDAVPLPHPSGASPWHRTETGKSLLARAMRLIGEQPGLMAGHRRA